MRAKVFVLVVIEEGSVVKCCGNQVVQSREMVSNSNNLNRDAAITSTVTCLFLLRLFLASFLAFTSLIMLATTIHITGLLRLYDNPVHGFNESVEAHEQHAKD